MRTFTAVAKAVLLFACVNLFVFCKKTAPKTDPQPVPEEPERQTANLSYTGGIRIAWDHSTMKRISAAAGYNGYSRLIQLADRSLMCTYEAGGSVVVVKSMDKGVTWSAPVTVHARTGDTNMAVPDILQLKDGSILIMYNPRPYNIAPGRNFAIRTKKSYDNGLTWTDERLVYEAHHLFENGCWEPAAIQLPNGEVQLFFANENEYRSSNEQNISVVRSNDNGLTWSAPQIASFRAGKRDGMPAPVLLKNGTIAFAIEDNADGEFKPGIIRNSISDNWAQPVTATSDKRNWALMEQLGNNIHAGAPYLRQLSRGETILSYQGTDDRTAVSQTNLDFAEQKIVIGNSDARSFNRKSVPFPIPGNKHGLWNSVNVIEDDVVVALTSTNGFSTGGATEVWMIKGYVIPELSATNATINIDSKTDDAAWNAAPFPVFVGHKSLTSARATLTYDNNNLYVLTNVTDPGVNNAANTEEGDGVSVLVSTKAQTYAQPGAGVFRVFVSADNKVVVKEGNNGNWVSRNSVSVKTATITYGKGYMQEIAIPWVMIGGKPATNSAIGFNLGLTENNGGSFAAQKETVDSCPELKPDSWMTVTIK